MGWRFNNWLIGKVSKWLLKEYPPKHSYLCDFDRISYEVRPGDVLLIEGCHRISNFIRQVTHSLWSHAALYIGRLHDIENPQLRASVRQHYSCQPSDQLLIESLLGQGTIISPLSKYGDDHVRICRPQGLSRQDAQKIIAFAISHLGTKYSLRHVFDLARFLLAWGIPLRQWRSSLFEHNKRSKPAEEICSAMIAEAFSAVHFPILPLIQKDGQKGLELIDRNPRLCIPSDFDYSPYFAIIKYPTFPVDEPRYRHLPWKEGVISDDVNITVLPREPTLPAENPATSTKVGTSRLNKS